MKVSVFYDHILQAAEQTGKPLSKLLCEVREAGIEAVEINLYYLESHEETLSLLKEADLKVSCIYEFYEMDKADAVIAEKERQKAERHIAMAKRMGAAGILVVPGFLEETEAREMGDCAREYDRIAAFFESNEKAQNIKAGMEYMVSLGEKAGVTVTVEDFDDYKSPVSRMQGILWFLKKVPGLRYTLDMGNFIYSGEDVWEAWGLLKEYVSHVHCKDRGKKADRPDEFLLSVAAGEGYLPIGELVSKLKEDGYAGYLAIEHFDAPNQEDCMKRSAAYLLHEAGREK